MARVPLPTRCQPSRCQPSRKCKRTAPTASTPQYPWLSQRKKQKVPEELPEMPTTLHQPDLDEIEWKDIGTRWALLPASDVLRAHTPIVLRGNPQYRSRIRAIHQGLLGMQAAKPGATTMLDIMPPEIIELIAAQIPAEHAEKLPEELKKHVPLATWRELHQQKFSKVLSKLWTCQCVMCEDLSVQIKFRLKRYYF